MNTAQKTTLLLFSSALACTAFAILLDTPPVEVEVDAMLDARTEIAEPLERSPAPEQRIEDPVTESEDALLFATGRSDRFAPSGTSRPREVVVHVVRAGSEIPVAQATVFHAPSAHLAAGGSRHPGRFFGAAEKSLEAKLRARGRRDTTDAAGRVTIPVKNGIVAVLAVEGGRAGRAFLGQLFVSPRAASSLRRVVLRLALVDRVAVRVLDEQGRAVGGLPLGLRGGSNGSVRPIGTTDDHEGMLSIPAPVEGRIVVDLPGLRGVGIAVDADRGSLEPLVLTLPGTASVSLRVRDRRGEAVADAEVRMAVVRDDDSDGRFAVRCHTGRTDADGDVSFPMVGLGQEFCLEVHSRGRVVEQRFAGPRFAGSPFEVVVDVTEAVVALVGHASDRESGVMANRSLALSYRCAGVPGTVRTRTDERGAFEFELPRRIVDATVTEVRLLLLDKSSRMTGRTAAIDLERIVDGSHSVGTVYLDRTPLLVAGSVRGATHDACAARVIVECMGSAGDWCRVPGAGFYRVGASGFEFRGHVQAARYRLRLLGEKGAGAEPVEFAAGQSGVEIAL